MNQQITYRSYQKSVHPDDFASGKWLWLHTTEYEPDILTMTNNELLIALYQVEQDSVKQANNSVLGMTMI